MSASSSGSSGTHASATEVFARWVERQASSEGESFEVLLEAHPALEEELRALRADWEKVQALLVELGLTRSPGQRLRQRHGSEADPGISLDVGEKPEEPGDFTSGVFRRLAGRRGEIGRYQLRGEIASGGQGAILRVWDEDLRRHLAMKVLLGQTEPARGGETPPVDSRALARFLEEAQVTGQLDHPGIVPVHELGLDSAGRVYFTMKLVQGKTLKEVFELAVEEREGWTRTRVLSVLLKVCEAMAYAHHKGVVHRDLKPANVMVGRFGEVFVMDWGLARVLGSADTKDVRLAPQSTTASLRSECREADSDSDSPLLTMDGDVVGTPAYMSTEQAQGRLDAIGPHTDVYAVGAMLYHLLAQQMPYSVAGARVSNHTILAMVLQGPPAPLRGLQKEIPVELEAICEKAMAREPERRYRDTSELAEDLRAYLENRVVKAHRTGALVELRKWVERNKALAAASAAAVLALVAGVATSLGYASRAQDAAERAEALATSEADARRKAQANAEEARRLEEEATTSASALWAIEELKRFWTLDDDLEYARSQDRPVHVWWLEQAHELVDGRPADPGQRTKASLEDHRRLLERIRGEAGEQEEVDRERDWWKQHLSELVHDLEELRDRIVLAERCLESRETEQEWEEAIEEIGRSEKYGGLRITPQLELVPLGPDPQSGLWEFAHVPTGEPAVRGDDGKLTLKPESGIVFVLLPAGGVPVEDGKDPTPMNEVELHPFFLSKYEMTVEQWARSSRGHGGSMEEGPLLPANGVSWYDCVETLERAGLFLRLPTEAQWEYGCRAGTTTPWWTGATNDARSAAQALVDFINHEQAGAEPVGRLAANPFGLHDVHGNVWEWCRDEYVEDDNAPVRPDDGEREARGANARAVRDGIGFRGKHARSSGSRDGYPPEVRLDYLGLRVARSLTP